MAGPVEAQRLSPEIVKAYTEQAIREHKAFNGCGGNAVLRLLAHAEALEAEIAQERSRADEMVLVLEDSRELFYELGRRVIRAQEALTAARQRVVEACAGGSLPTLPALLEAFDGPGAAVPVSPDAASARAKFEALAAACDEDEQVMLVPLGAELLASLSSDSDYEDPTPPCYCSETHIHNCPRHAHLQDRSS